MKKAYWLLLSVTFFLLLALINFQLYYLHYQKTHLQCHSNLTIINDSYSINTRVSFAITGNVGQTYADGEVVNKNGDAHAMSRMALSHVKQSGNYLYFTNYSVSELPGNTADNTILKALIPAYFLFNNVSNRLSLYPVAGGDYLIANDQYVILYCKK